MEIKKLEKIVYEEFGNIIRDIKLLGGAKILDYKLNYTPALEGFEIKITKLDLSHVGNVGRIIDDDSRLSRKYGCPHDYLNLICGFNNAHPNIKEFRRKYSINNIDVPDNDCEHK